MTKGKPPEWALNRGTDSREIEPGVIVRHNEDGTIDEVCIDLGNKAHFHLEQMDDNVYWIGINWRDANGKDRMQHVTVSAVKARVYPTVYT